MSSILLEGSKILLRGISLLSTKQKGDIGEAVILAEILKSGYKIAKPIGEDFSYDLIAITGNRFIKVQCKYIESDSDIIKVKCRSTNNWSNKKYTEEDIDYLAVYCPTNNKCYFIPAIELGNGVAAINLRLTPTKNGQSKGIRFAKDYEAINF